ncbi:head GIN domain-containing protein [Robertkochia aurantiaca]|uniref:head GIN domain-containing protein n=1 Tax=Robertkochia aurantiaca TaxID=2873700 RepID=UPI001CCD4303|nr:head GIN domain-containing protein [Robertkochia sp. 3YJGBD-33]
MRDVKIIVLIVISLIFWGCDSPDAGDCWQTSGEIVSREVALQAFDRILVNEGVKAVVRQGESYKAVITSGENLIDDVTLEVKEGQLIVSNNNGCNLFRSYGNTEVLIQAPDFREIRSSTQFAIRSEGRLQLQDLNLLSEGFLKPDMVTNGEFYLDIEADRLRMTFNGLANAYLSGRVRVLSIGIAAGNSRVEAASLEAEHVLIYHRGSNDLLVNPLNLVEGDLYGTGDLILYNRPDSLDVTEHYRGRLLYAD